MKSSKIKAYVFFILIALLGGVLTGWVVSDGIDQFNLTAVKPALTPPAEVFPIVWTALYTLMGISAAMVWNRRENGDDLFIFWMQLLFNYLWCFLFFGFQAYLLSFIWLIVLFLLIVTMISSFRSKCRAAALLQIPYAVWTAFAVYLNCSVWLMNK